MIKLNLSFLLLFLPFCLLGQTFSPKADWRFDNFSSQNHFTSRQIVSLAFDKHGYLWAAGSGVHRFDGFRTIDYSSYNPTPGSIKDNYVDVIADSNGRIWVSSSGLCYYNDVSDKFVYVQPVAGPDLNYAYALLAQKDQMWFVSDRGLGRIDVNTLKIQFTSLSHVTDALTTYAIDDTTLLVSSREKVYIYNIKQNTYTTHVLTYKQALVKIFAVAKRGHEIYLGTTRGLFTFNNLKDVVLADKQTEDLAMDDMLFLPGDKEKRYLLISTERRGLMIYNTVSKKIEYNYIHDDNNPYSLASNKIAKLFLDDKGRLWIGTALGVSVLDLLNQQWKMRFINQSNAEVLDVHKIAADKFDSTKFWVAPYNQGMICMDWKTKKTGKIYSADKELLRISDFVQLSANKFLIAGTKQIFEWSPLTGVSHIQKLPVPDTLALGYNVRNMIMADGRTCFITSSVGLFKYDLATRKITEAATDRKLNHYYDLLTGFYDRGLLWIACRYGVLRYDIATRKTNLYAGKKMINHFYFDIADVDNDRLVCAAATGITIFNKRTKKFKIINTIGGLSKPKCSNVICINNRVWIGSDAGLLNYDLNTQRSSKVEHESATMEIAPTSAFEIIGNAITMGFGNGYAYFTPDLDNMTMPSNPVIEGFSVNNKALFGHYPGQKLRFGYTDNSINIAFTAFLYNDVNNITFRYKLKGADAGWQYTDNLRSANYAQLRSGNYTFYVQSGNKNGLWNKHLAAISFTITPPFWATWWFRVLFIMLIVLILYALYSYKIKHIKDIEHIRQSIASDFHDDLGSTLSSISIFSEVAVQKAETDLAATKSMMGDIGTRARAMIHSMNDMVWTIKPENDNLYKLMQRMEEFSYPVAEAKEIQLLFLMDENLYEVKTDMVRRKNLFLIFKEAFNNAVKYGNSESIEVQFKFKNKLLMMQIVDNGCGFEYESRRQGNGMANMQKRAAEIKGKLKITTTIGGGTCIKVVCKIT